MMYKYSDTCVIQKIISPKIIKYIGLRLLPIYDMCIFNGLELYGYSIQKHNADSNYLSVLTNI